ncbi:hypothetical protein SAMN06265795_11970 [Noviherbaspirillum humi]|uniref:Uncharacterized protein n=1 Tax=Noviherbaspirillum humi TaxID=1688639 RepID=A0A239L5Q6_9BURK|nr:hypothetical protein [Noviherbaspirillum humi]SNT25665.1 hypothetical protein SAMN06265795_11970 [Noviherbaspirillum humi]
MNEIERLRAMAREAIVEYYREMQAGRNPSYPRWVNDALEVCKKAEIGRQFSYLHELRVQTKRLTQR